MSRRKDTLAARGCSANSGLQRCISPPNKPPLDIIMATVDISLGSQVRASQITNKRTTTPTPTPANKLAAVTATIR